MKIKTLYTCKTCQFETNKWTGRCPNCDGWNSFEEGQQVIASKNSLSKTPRTMAAKSAAPLLQSYQQVTKISTGINEFDHVLGDGITPSSLILFTGEPGIGKSTLTLQIAANISQQQKVLLISGEESVEQIAGRASRLKLNNENLLALNESNLETILATIKAEGAKFVIIDSIQVVSSLEIPGTAGSITQVRYCTEQLMEVAKSQNITVILIGHVTKDGTLAGPKVLEHLVDTVLLLEGDRFQQFRILKSSKNRFGSCNEVGIFEMTEEGLQEVKNPSAQFLSGRRTDAIGSVITTSIEGTRPFLVEVQALVSVTHFGYPKRAANGFDLNRLQILTAVLEKYSKINLQNQDIFVNIVGGIKLREPAADLAVLLAIASSYLKKPLPVKALAFGEVGLSGELRKVSHHEKRLKESLKMGFTQIISPEEFKEINEALKTLHQ